LKQTDGTLINVGVKFLPFVLLGNRTILRIGDPLTMGLTKILPAAKKENSKVLRPLATMEVIFQERCLVSETLAAVDRRRQGAGRLAGAIYPEEHKEESVE